MPENGEEWREEEEKEDEEEEEEVRQAALAGLETSQVRAAAGAVAVAGGEVAAAGAAAAWAAGLSHRKVWRRVSSAAWPAAPGAVAMNASSQGLTLVHFSAQLERTLWERGCSPGLHSPC
jgi:hypothetical protein